MFWFQSVSVQTWPLCIPHKVTVTKSPFPLPSRRPPYTASVAHFATVVKRCSFMAWSMWRPVSQSLSVHPNAEQMVSLSDKLVACILIVTGDRLLAIVMGFRRWAILATMLGRGGVKRLNIIVSVLNLIRFTAPHYSMGRGCTAFQGWSEHTP